jgi:1,4-dihydroxy-6-naphthoate synthase
MPKVTLAHSPDPDDAFMFYALAAGKIGAGEWEFEHLLQDIQTLNERALRGELDLTAVSIHAYAHLADTYALMPCGASMGDGYGPMIVGPRQFSREELRRVRLAVPGKLTSAYLALQLYLGRADAELDTVVVPFDRVFDALRAGDAEAGLLIHEGQLTWEAEGFARSVDLGVWWGGDTGGLPLPLGGNVVHRRFTPEQRRELTRIVRESIRYGLEHRADGVAHALPLGRGLDRAQADRFIGMYVNDLTLDYGERGRRAIETFLRRGREAGLVPAVEIVWSE